MQGSLWKNRDLLWLLTVREIRIRYARALLGAGWALTMPLVMMATFTVLSFDRLVPPDSPHARAGVPYSVFAYAGLLAWTHFSTAVTTATPSLVQARDILAKSAFPKEVIPLAKVLSALLDLAIGAVFLVALMIWKDLPFHPTALAVLPILVLQVLFTAGVVLLTSAGNMFFRDVNYLVQVGVLLAMFATAVVYPIDPAAIRPAWAGEILRWNPMSSFLDAYRAALFLGEWPWARLLPGVLGAALALAVGGGVFRSQSHRFAEEV
jgi:ABC-type polysaccharide/polyol phosphate export permease